MSTKIKDASLYQWVARETNTAKDQVQKVIALIEEGNTVPFIARYRKEITGGLDEVQIHHIQEKWTYALNLEERKQEVLRLIDEQGKLTEDLKQSIMEAEQLQRVEDLYRPYRQKRRTRATIAKEKGLEPLAKIVWEQETEDLTAEIESYINEEIELHSAEDVLAGVNDILAEWISDDPTLRQSIREATFKHGQLSTTFKKNDQDPKQVYKMYYDYTESLRSLVAHRILAINRGEKEDVLQVRIEPPEERIERYLIKQILKRNAPQKIADLLKAAIEDSYKRFIQPSIEREIRQQLTEQAESQAISVFSENLKNLLLQPPLKGRIVLGIDPAYRTGCKLAVVDETGKVLAIDVMYPTAPHHDLEGAEKVLKQLIEQFPIELIAIGNGTASRETEQFVATCLQKHGWDLSYVIVDEAGASVYSASSLAREEFPDLEVEERSAVSIARRVQDPLAELVKIDPQSIGVGQYQHDVRQKDLKKSLSFVVETAVNQVGVNVNTASTSLLEHVSGLNKTVAKNIVKHRNEIGRFSKREDLKDVPRLGPKTYEQSIGFLRIIDGVHPLDRTPIHPESYPQTKKFLEQIECDLDQIGTEYLKERLKALNISEMAEQLEIGEPTLKDIIEALIQPERDVRDDYPQPLLQQDIIELEDLKPGMKMQGTVRNVVDFGAFIDIGVGQDGLVHISKLAHTYVKHPMDIVSVGDVVTVWVEEVDVERGRISLSMIADEQE